MCPVTVEQLKNIETLKEVPDEQLLWFINSGVCQEFKEGDLLFRTGDTINSTYIILEGKVRICMLQNGKIREIAEFDEGSVTGYLPFSRGVKTFGYCECVKPATILICPKDEMKKAIHMHYELTEALVHIMTSRVRDFTALQQQSEKMVALGKLSAGLAHELNNPAAAIARGASTLKKQIDMLPAMFKEIAGIQMNSEQIDSMNIKLAEIGSRTALRPLTMVERSNQEDELTDWLLDNEIKDYDIAENLVDSGFTSDDLNELKQYVPQSHLLCVFTWISNNLNTEKLITDIQESSRRISDLVGSIKNFTRMDKDDDKALIDIHTGLQNTLMMLNYKFRKGNIELIEEYDRTIPYVKAMAGELNQVWTNLIDNSLDAMEENGKGVLKISTNLDGQFVQIKITDNGTGIPADIQSRIYDPFFTTKEMGKGTGLGLDVVLRIVRQHNGTIKLNSEPGKTEFTVCFPINN